MPKGKSNSSKYSGSRKNQNSNSIATSTSAPGGKSAYRNRQFIQRDYGAANRFEYQKEQASRDTLQAGLGLIQQIAGGVEALAAPIEENIKSHEAISSGAEKVFKSGVEEGLIQSDTEFENPIDEMGWAKKWFTSPDPTKTMTIGGKEYSSARLEEIGLGVSTGIVDPNTGERKNLYDSYGEKMSDVSGLSSQSTSSPSNQSAFLPPKVSSISSSTKDEESLFPEPLPTPKYGMDDFPYEDLNMKQKLNLRSTDYSQFMQDNPGLYGAGQSKAYQSKKDFLEKYPRYKDTFE